MIPTLIVPTLTHYDLLQNMLNSIDIPVDRIIVIDNGGSLESVECSLANTINIISLPSNIGVASSWNLGIKLTAFSEWWLIANDDILWNPGSLSRLCKHVGKMNIVADWGPFSAFSGFAIDDEAIASIGLFDEYYYPGVGEELNYWRRAIMSGVSGIQINDLFSLQGHIGRTRKYLDEKIPGTGARIMDNVNKATINAEKVIGWSLMERRSYPHIG